jgi:hypothetical protein
MFVILTANYRNMVAIRTVRDAFSKLIPGSIFKYLTKTR